LVPPSTHHALAAVAGLRKGRRAAKESTPVKPVDDAQVAAALPFNRFVSEVESIEL
jgi:hypothetical protein